MKSSTKTVTIAWTETRDVFSHERRKLEQVVEAYACVWVLHGDDTDVAKATAYVNEEYPGRGQVFCYDPKEPKPQARARQDILLATYSSAS